MRIEVGTVRTSGRIALAAAGVVWTCGTFSSRFEPQNASLTWVCARDFVAAYGLSFLSFAAFPFTRRTDLVKGVILVAILADMARVFIGRGGDFAGLGAYAAGAFAVLIPSFMERFRSLTRADPHEPFSMVYPNDRRRRVKTSRHQLADAKPVRAAR